jgi:NAD-dependent dihydropyrimidine dehydrogenase PreA subunit
MTYVITSPCVDVKDGGCVPACPVDCIYEGGRMLYIHPNECIGCGLCESICPVGAIWEDGELDDADKPFIEVNAAYFEPDVSGLGSPHGAKALGASEVDHPVVAAHPRQKLDQAGTGVEPAE